MHKKKETYENRAYSMRPETHAFRGFQALFLSIVNRLVY